MIICWYFLFLPGSILEGCLPCLEFVHFFQVVHFIGVWLLLIVSYDPLYFCGVSCDFFFISKFIESSFFSWWAWIKAYQFFISSKKNQLLFSLISAVVFFVSSSFISALIFMIQVSLWHHFSNTIGSSCVSVSNFDNLIIYQTFSLLLCLLWWSVISTLGCYYYNCFGGTTNHVHIRWWP